MSELKRTVLYQAHLDAGATMVDFGGWDMPIQYPDGIVAEHLYCRRHCGIFDVSHMGRIDVEGTDMIAFLQHVLSSNVLALDLDQAQYCIFRTKTAAPSMTRTSTALRRRSISSSSMRATSRRTGRT